MLKARNVTPSASNEQQILMIELLRQKRKTKKFPKMSSASNEQQILMIESLSQERKTKNFRTMTFASN